MLEAAKRTAHEKISEKLRLLKSPLVSEDSDDDEALKRDPRDGEPNLNYIGNRIGALEGTPEFQRHQDASTLELFFDLFFAANYSVFSETQSVTSSERFNAYVGYFCILWITWLLVGLYDVRYVTDSIFERCTRGVQLGVMVGFAVVAPHFTPNDQDTKTMRTMSLILMVSRFCLAIEYASILWHVRKFKKARLPLYFQIGICFVAGLIYMGLTFRFDGKDGSRAFIAWYVVAALEVILTFAISNIWSVLSFTTTHLMKRLSTLTVIILGDAVVIVANNVVTIVEGPNAWDALTIGVVTAATATIYFIFLIYFDWMKHDHLPPWRQQLWSFLHFPLHLSLVIFMQGFTQFIIWSKVVDILNHLSIASVLDTYDSIYELTSEDLQRNLTDVAYKFFETYPPKWSNTWTSVDNALANITTIPDDFWPVFANFAVTLDPETMPPYEQIVQLDGIVTTIFSGMANAMFETFGIDVQEELLDESKKQNGTDILAGSFQSDVVNTTWHRYQLIFGYGYICAGITLFLMTMLTVISRSTPWRPWPIIRTCINVLFALGMGLVALLWYYPNSLDSWLYSAWLVPTLTLIWFIILVMTHINNAKPVFFPKTATALITRTATGLFSINRKPSYGPVVVKDGDRKPEEVMHSYHKDVEIAMPQTTERSLHGQYPSQQQDITAVHENSDRVSSEYDPYEQPTEYRPGYQHR